MHTLQKRLLEYARTYDLGKMSLRKIGELLGEKHPQKIKHHLSQLEQKGFIAFDRDLRTVKRVRPEVRTDGGLASIPILGSASCGPAAMFAQQNIQGYLQVSNRLIKPKTGLFALRARGSSMNKAQINGSNIEEGDYVIVDSKRRTPRTRDYVISVIGGLANIKCFIKDEQTQQIILMSESTQKFPPIVLHPADVEYMVCGTVILVVKTPNVI
jgi:repressor LexA